MQNLIDYKLFKRSIFVANLSDASVMDLLEQYIKQYQKKFLIKLLGSDLYKEFDQAISGEDPIPEEWQKLIDILVDSEIDESPIANYVFCMMLENENTTNSGIGVVRLIGENSENVSLWDKYVKAWNDMVDMICGLHQKLKAYPSYVYKNRACICKEVYSSCGCSEPVFSYKNTLNL